MNVNQGYLNQKRQEGDDNADYLIEKLFEDGSPKTLYHYFKLTENQLKNSTEENDVKNFLLKRKAFPDWLDFQKIQCGQDFYAKYASEIMMLLGAMSLPYCYAASPGNKALYLTGKMNKSAGKRLLETADFIIAVLTSGSFEPEGKGWLEVNKTRLIHALVRYHVKKQKHWDHSWGLPINQEDMAGTNLAFSYIILLGLEKWGFRPTNEEKDSFLHLWRFIGYLLEIEEALLPANIQEAEQLEQTIKARHFKYSEEGAKLSADLMKHYKDSLKGLGRYFVDGQVRYFIGEDISAMLGLEKEKFKDSVITLLNKVTFSINNKRKITSSYDKMLRDHERLKRIYF